MIQGENTRLVDRSSANGKYFAQLAGAGLDAQVVKETSLAFKRSFDPLSVISFPQRRPVRLWQRRLF